MWTINMRYSQAGLVRNASAMQNEAAEKNNQFSFLRASISPRLVHLHQN